MPLAVDFQGGVTSAWSNVITFMPKLAAALVIILAGIAILVFGAFVALDQLQIAPRIVTGLWYAILAIVVGSAVVAVGGGGIKTMQRYWERATHQGRGARPPSSSSRPSSPPRHRPSMTATGRRRHMPTRPPRSSRPSGPAAHGGTARPSRRRDASAGPQRRGVPSANHQPQAAGDQPTSAMPPPPQPSTTT